jgi:hypothetical protein
MVWVFLVWKGCLEGMNNVGTNYQSDFGKGSLNSIGQQMLQYHHYQPIKQPPYNTTIINQSNNHLSPQTIKYREDHDINLKEVNTNFTVLFRIIGQKFVYSQYSQPCLM